MENNLYNVCDTCCILAGCVDIDGESPTGDLLRNDDYSIKCEKCGSPALYTIDQAEFNNINLSAAKAQANDLFYFLQEAVDMMKALAEIHALDGDHWDFITLAGEALHKAGKDRHCHYCGVKDNQEKNVVKCYEFASDEIPSDIITVCDDHACNGKMYDEYRNCEECDRFLKNDLGNFPSEAQTCAECLEQA